MPRPKNAEYVIRKPRRKPPTRLQSVREEAAEAHEHQRALRRGFYARNPQVPPPPDLAA